MPRENETYRLELEQALAYFEGKRILSVSDIAEYVGHDRKWCRKHLGISGKDGVTVVKLAYLLSHL
jgi:hypothetical protein